MRPAFGLSRTGTSIRPVSVLLPRRRPGILARLSSPRKGLLAGRGHMSSSAKMENGSAEREHGKSEDASDTSTRSSLFAAIFGIWTAALSCLSNAAVSLEGDLDRKFAAADLWPRTANEGALGS